MYEINLQQFNFKRWCVMENLKPIISGYKDLFYKTGKVDFFMMYRSLEKLDSNISKLDAQINHEENLTI